MNISRKAWPILLLTGIIFFSMTARSIFSPLLPYIKDALGLNQAQAGSFFLIISFGYSPTMMLSGFVAERLRHRGTIILAILLFTLGLLVAAASSNYLFIGLGLFLIGVGSGMYPPSGIASLTSLVSTARTGQAIAIHELGPNVSLVVAPLLVLLFYKTLSWRGLLLLLAALNLVILMIFVKRRNIGEFTGSPPKYTNLKVIILDPAILFITFLFFVALASTQGVFSILPLYLVTTKGLDPDSVNRIVSFSRIAGLFVLLGSGSLVDRFGAKPVMMTAFIVSGACTVLVGLFSGTLLVVFVALQPALILAFFPAGLTMLSRLGPKDSRNVTFAVVINISVFLGTGFIPSFFGWLGDFGAPQLGFILLGAATLLAAVLTALNRSFGPIPKE